MLRSVTNTQKLYVTKLYYILLRGNTEIISQVKLRYPFKVNLCTYVPDKFGPLTL